MGTGFFNASGAPPEVVKKTISNTNNGYSLPAVGDSTGSIAAGAVATLLSASVDITKDAVARVYAFCAIEADTGSYFDVTIENESGTILATGSGEDAHNLSGEDTISAGTHTYYLKVKNKDSAARTYNWAGNIVVVSVST